MQYDIHDFEFYSPTDDMPWPFFMESLSLSINLIIMESPMWWDFNFLKYNKNE